MVDAASTLFPPDQPGDQAASPAQSAPAPRQPRQPMSLALNSDQRYARQTRSLADGRNSLSGEPEVLDDEAVADRMFAQPDPAAAPQAQQAAPRPAPMADPLITPANIQRQRQEARDADPAARMFAGSPVDLDLADLITWDDPMATEARVKALGAEMSRVLCDDLALPANDAREITNLIREVRTAYPTQQQEGEWSRSAWQQLEARYGKTAPQVLADAKRLIARDPRAVRILDNTRLGNHPSVVLKAAEAALRLKAQGRL